MFKRRPKSFGDNLRLLWFQLASTRTLSRLNTAKSIETDVESYCDLVACYALTSSSERAMYLLHAPISAIMVLRGNTSSTASA